MAASRRSRQPRNRFITQAGLEALLRFGPELSGLKELQRAAETNYRTRVGQARATARGTIDAVNRARPEVKKVYDRAGLEQARTASTLVGKDLAALGPVADSIKAGAALEQTVGLRHLQESRAAALTDLSTRRVQARQGQGFAVTNARRELVSELARIFERKQDLARERGAFTALTARQLRQAARERADRLAIAQGGWSQSERNSLRSAGIDPDTGRPIPGGRLDPRTDRRPRPRASLERHEMGVDAVGKAIATLRSLDPARDRDNRRDLGDLLKTGQDAVPLLDEQGKPRVKNGRALKTPKVPSIPQPWVRVALELYYDGRISESTRRWLRRNGYSVRQLGFTTQAQWDRRDRPTTRPHDSQQR